MSILKKTSSQAHNASVLLYEPVPLDRPKLRIGVMLDGLETERWIKNILDEIRDSVFAEIVLVILNEEKLTPVLPNTALAKLSSRFKGQFFWQYSKFDARRHGNASYLAKTSVADTLAGAAILRVTPVRKGFVHRFLPDDVKAVQDHQIDVVLRFGFNILRGDVLRVARYGVWSFHHGDNMEYRGGPAMFWEIYEKNPVTGTVLQILTEALDNGRIIYRSWGATGRSLWLSSSREPLYRKASPFVIRCLRKLYLAGGASLPEETPTCSYAKNRIYKRPTEAHMARFLAKAARASFLGRVENRLSQMQWFMAYRHDRSKFIANTSSIDMSGFTLMESLPHEFWADPFVFQRDGVDYVFFERYNRETARGDICVFSFDEAGRPRPFQLALSRDYHLSNPFVFEWDGAIYMLPETADIQSLQLFRAVEFPTQWEHDRDLMTGLPMVDANLYCHEGRWYLFVNVSENGGPLEDELFLFHADTPLGPWHPHPQNPIKSDVRSARPAGRLFMRNGALIRPAQDCSVTYGYAVNLCEVQALSPTAYSERIVGRINPDWHPGLYGCHTLNASNSVEMVDGKKRIRVAARHWA